MNNEDFDWDEFLHRCAIWGGAAMAIISIYFSYDGLDQTVTGGNPNYTEIAKYIGVAMAIFVTLIQFVFNTDIKQLTTTLVVGGILSYFYSITTNYLGLNHLFGFHGVLGGLIAGFWDALPEALIAWGLRDTANGDAIRNILNFASGAGRNKNRQNRSNQSNNRQPERREPAFREESTRPVFPVQNKSKGGGFERRGQLEGQRKNGQTERPNRFLGE